MSRLRVVAALVVVCGVGVVVACSEKESSCTVDTDCAQGSFCREGLCASASGSDAGAPDVQLPITCSSGTSGTSGASGTSGSTSSGSSCVDLYGLCSTAFECCTGLACTTGTCR